MPVEKARDDYNTALVLWKRLRDCYNGRDAILKAGHVYVPDLPGQDAAGNEAYRKRGSFYNAVKRTVKGLNGAIFQEAPEVEMLESLTPMLDDITLSNVPFETFAAEAGEEVFLTGRYGVLVDMPLDAAAAVKDGSITNPIAMRPYCVGYCAEDIINWRTERRGGDDILTMVVLSEKSEEGYSEADPFTCALIDQFRVVMLNALGQCIQQIWRKINDKWVKSTDGDVVLMRRGQALTFVPFVFLGPTQSTPDVEHPPLIDLADINLGHWRNSVDYEYGLHLVALPTPWVSGAKGGGETSMLIGPSVVWELDVQGSAGMLEFQGTGLGAIVSAMEEKKKQMATLGARLLEDSPSSGQETLGAVRLRHTGETASLKTVAQALEQGFTQMLQICVWWQTVDTTPADSATNVELNKEYIDVRATPQEIQVALAALQSGEMSFDTWYNLLASGGWAREGIDAKQELKDIGTRKIDVSEPPPDPSITQE